MSKQWFELIRLPSDMDLAEVNAFLVKQGVEHRFTEDGDEQILWLTEQHHGPFVQDFLDRYLRGEIQLAEANKVALFEKFKWYFFITEFPATCLILMFGFAGYILAGVIQNSYAFDNLAFLPVVEAFIGLQPWRILTPAFLHFSILHFVLNIVWIIYLGRRLESYFGFKKYLVLFLVSAVSANILQFHFMGANNFGGLSGVVYGYIGAFLVGHCVFNVSLLRIQEGLIWFSVLALILGFTGTFEWVTGTAIANWAHLGGFLAGIIYMYFYLMAKKKT